MVYTFILINVGFNGVDVILFFFFLFFPHKMGCNWGGHCRGHEVSRMVSGYCHLAFIAFLLLFCRLCRQVTSGRLSAFCQISKSQIVRKKNTNIPPAVKSLQTQGRTHLNTFVFINAVFLCINIHLQNVYVQ